MTSIAIFFIYINLPGGGEVGQTFIELALSQSFIML